MDRNVVFLIAILLLGAWLRFDDAARDVRFHSDEALYSTYARGAAVYGTWLLEGPVDKPPLSIYATALAMHFTAASINDFGVIDVPIKQGEFAAKLPNLFAGVITTALVYALAITLFSHKAVALIASLLVAISPYAIAYSASAFTDALMLVLMLASVLSAVRGKSAYSGVWMALSIASKPQGVFYLPLVLFFLLIGQSSIQIVWNHLKRFALAFFSGILLLLIWDSIRPETSVFILGSINISQGRSITASAEWLPRLIEWLHLGDNLFGWGWFSALIVILAGMTLWQHRSRANRIIALTAGGYFAVHWIGAFFTFDRYLLPLVPLLALLAAQTIHAHMPPKRHTTALMALMSLIMLINIPATHNARADVYRGTSAHALIHLADYLNAKPLGAIIYDRWMGWEMGYYMGAWSDKRRVYYPDAQTQALDALCNPDTAPRYFVAPHNQNYTPWLTAFESVGFTINHDYMRDGFSVYQLIPPPGVALGASAFESSLPGQVSCDDAVLSFSHAADPPRLSPSWMPR